MIIKKNYIIKVLSFFLIPFILSILLTNALEENEINSKNITKSYLKYFHPIPIINRTVVKTSVQYFFIPKLKLGTCLVGKTGSTITRMIFCYLNKKKNDINQYDFPLCNVDRKNFDNLKNFEKSYGVKKFNKFFKKFNFVRFVRNPIERLISGFMHLCYYGVDNKDHFCFGCNKNLTCFLNILEKRLWQTLNHKVIPYKENEEFVYSFHFYPQTWSCEYYKYHKNFTNIKYDSTDKDSFSNNIDNLLLNFHVSNETINFIKKRIDDIKIEHTTLSKNETSIYKNILYNNPFLLQKVCSIYYFDFIKFDYEFPKECKN